MFWVSDEGVLQATKRFEAHPACMRVYRQGHRPVRFLVPPLVSGSTRLDPLMIFCRAETDKEHVDILLGMHDNTLLVLRDQRLMWCAALDFIPVTLRIASFWSAPERV